VERILFVKASSVEHPLSSESSWGWKHQWKKSVHASLQEAVSFFPVSLKVCMLGSGPEESLMPSP
jgi:hypothetical protein